MSDYPKSRSSKRVSAGTACTECVKRHLRCSDHTPCKQCERANIPNLCVRRNPHTKSSTGTFLFIDCSDKMMKHFGKQDSNVTNSARPSTVPTGSITKQKQNKQSLAKAQIHAQAQSQAYQPQAYPQGQAHFHEHSLQVRKYSQSFTEHAVENQRQFYSQHDNPNKYYNDQYYDSQYLSYNRTPYSTQQFEQSYYYPNTYSNYSNSYFNSNSYSCPCSCCVSLTIEDHANSNPNLVNGTSLVGDSYCTNSSQRITVQHEEQNQEESFDESYSPSFPDKLEADFLAEDDLVDLISINHH